MSNQEVSIVLEIVSFFLVAVDLYGKSRLQRTHDFLLKIFNKTSDLVNKVRDQEWEKEKEERVKKITYWFFIIAGICLYAIFLISFWSDESRWTSRFMFPLLASVVFTLLIALSLMLLIAGFLLFTRLFRGITFSFIRLLQATKIEGLLLAIGSLIFLLSKYYEWNA